MVCNPILCYLSPNILIFQDPLIIETQNKCHWIWHVSNPEYAPLKPFWCIFPSQNQQNVKFLPEILIFQEPLIVEYLKPVPLDLAHLANPKYVPLKPFWCIFPSQNQQNVKFLPEILIFQELLIVDTWNLCHWIWHTSNPKYVPLKPFWCIFPSQNQQNVKFLPEILIFQEPLIVETWNLCHWIWHISNPKYIPLKPLWCIFPSQNQQNVKFLPEILIFWELLIVETWNKCHWIWHTSNPKYMPLKPLWCIFPSQNQQNVKFLPVQTPPTKNCHLCRERCLERLENLHRYWKCLCTMLHLCDKYFLRYYGFPWYLIGRFSHFWCMV